MANTSTSEHGENEIKNGAAVGTSVGKTSRKNERVPITRETRLRILQQSIYDCQECGFEVRPVLAVEGGIAIVILGIHLDQNGNLVPAEGKDK